MKNFFRIIVTALALMALFAAQDPVEAMVPPYLGPPFTCASGYVIYYQPVIFFGYTVCWLIISTPMIGQTCIVMIDPANTISGFTEYLDGNLAYVDMGPAASALPRLSGRQCIFAVLGASVGGGGGGGGPTPTPPPNPGNTSFTYTYHHNHHTYTETLNTSSGAGIAATAPGMPPSIQSQLSGGGGANMTIIPISIVKYVIGGHVGL